jgi:hypothetical protein
MSDVETLEQRLRTVERAVTEGDHTFPAVDDIAELTERVDAVERQVEQLDEQTAELEAATQALRGYVGNVRSVNDRVQQRADTALAATERLERRLDGDATAADGTSDSVPESRQESRERQLGADIGRVTSDRPAGDAPVHSDGSGGRPPDATDFDIGSTDATDDREGDESADSGVFARIRSLL